MANENQVVDEDTFKAWNADGGTSGDPLIVTWEADALQPATRDGNLRAFDGTVDGDGRAVAAATAGERRHRVDDARVSTLVAGL